jgi:hypothetical protein
VVTAGDIRAEAFRSAKEALKDRSSYWFSRQLSARDERRDYGVTGDIDDTRQMKATIYDTKGRRRGSNPLEHLKVLGPGIALGVPLG